MKAVERRQQALATFMVGGVDMDIPFLRFLLNEIDYREAKLNTR